MRRVLAVAALVLALYALPSPPAQAYPAIGFGEQRSGIFNDPHWSALALEDVRLVVGWDATSTRWQREELDAYMRAARAADARVLISFGRSRVASRNRVLPSPRRYRRAFIAFRKRYPDVNQFVVWNEANHCSQPTCHRPGRAAQYYNVARSVCAGACTLVAADVLDQDGMARWLRSFKRKARKGPKIWGLHNYLDANRFRTSGTRRLLRVVKGPVWFTETGGLVKRRNLTSPHRFPDSRIHAARAVRWVLTRLVPLSPRIGRVYLYHWSAPPSHETWDSAMMTPMGRPRPAYRVLVEELQRARARAVQ